MKLQFIRSLLTQRFMRRITAVWLTGFFLLAIGLTACGGQTNTPAVVPEGAGDGANVQAAPAADQTVTGFDIEGWF